jgi:hypothetical protein
MKGSNISIGATVWSKFGAAFYKIENLREHEEYLNQHPFSVVTKAYLSQIHHRKTIILLDDAYMSYF